MHKHVERPDIWWCAGSGMGPGRCTCPVFTDSVAEPFVETDFEDEEDEDEEPVGTPFEMSFVFVKRGESIVWQPSGPHTITIPARAVELAPAQKANGCISLEQTAEIHGYRLDCVIDDGALSGRRAAWVAILAGLSVKPSYEPSAAPGITFAQRDVCAVCSIPLDTLDEDVDVDRMFHAYDTIHEGVEAWILVPSSELFHLSMHFDPNALKPDEQIPIGFLRVVMHGMLLEEIAENDEVDE